MLKQKEIETSSEKFELLYKAGMENIISKLDYYYDKPYSCKSVLTTLFEEGVLKELQE